MFRSRFFLISAIFFLLSTGSVFSATTDVSITSQDAFSPSSITIDSGDTVRWTNTATGQNSENQVASDNHPSHDVYLDPQCPTSGCFDSPLLPTNATYTFTFMIPGTWDYHNHIKPAKTGIITVNDKNKPATTTDLIASSPTNNSVILTWTAPGDDVGSSANFGTSTSYDVRYLDEAITSANWSSASQVTGEPSPRRAGTQETMTVTGLSDNTTYYFALKSSDEVPNTSGLSNVVSVLTTQTAGGGAGAGARPVTEDLTPPGEIKDLNVTHVSASSVLLAWTAPGDDEYFMGSIASAYEIRYSTDTISEQNWNDVKVIINTPSPNIPSFKDSIVVSELPIGYNYFFAVRTVDENRNISKISNLVSLEIPDLAPPNKINSLKTVHYTGYSITLNWLAPGDDDKVGQATFYDIRYSTNTITEENWDMANKAYDITPPKLSGQEEFLSIFDLASTTKYYFAIKSRDDSRNISPLSNIATEITIDSIDDIPPAKIADLAMSETYGYYVTLIWTAVGDNVFQGKAGSYDIRYATSVITKDNWEKSLKIPSPLPHVAGTGETVTVFGLGTSTPYYFAIKVKDKHGNESKLSNIFGAGTLESPGDTTPPGQIGNLKILGAGTSSVKISWSATGNDKLWGYASYYDIRYSTSVITDSNWLSAAKVDRNIIPKYIGHDEELEIEGLFSGTTYYFSVRAGDAIPNESLASNVVSITTKELEKEELAVKISPKIIFIRPLYFSMNNKDVAVLQELLKNPPAGGPEIYPEGLVTGYFGHLTKKAVERFQKKHNILTKKDEASVGYGYVGPKTRAKLGEVSSGLAILPQSAKIEDTRVVIRDEPKSTSKPKSEPEVTKKSEIKLTPEEKKTTTPPESKPHTVLIIKSKFEPANLTIGVGDTVKWLNKNNRPHWPASDSHPTHDIFPEFDPLKGFGLEESYSFTFTRRGTWFYHDHLYPNLVGKIIVK